MLFISRVCKNWSLSLLLCLPFTLLRQPVSADGLIPFWRSKETRIALAPLPLIEARPKVLQDRFNFAHAFYNREEESINVELIIELFNWPSSSCDGVKDTLVKLDKQMRHSQMFDDESNPVMGRKPRKGEVPPTKYLKYGKMLVIDSKQKNVRLVLEAKHNLLPQVYDQIMPRLKDVVAEYNCRPLKFWVQSIGRSRLYPGPTRIAEGVITMISPTSGSLWKFVTVIDRTSNFDQLVLLLDVETSRPPMGGKSSEGLLDQALRWSVDKVQPGTYLQPGMVKTWRVDQHWSTDYMHLEVKGAIDRDAWLRALQTLQDEVIRFLGYPISWAVVNQQTGRALVQGSNDVKLAHEM